MEDNELIGIIGGVGPYAGLDFVEKIFNNTRAVKDQEHVNCMLISCSSLIPDRTEFLLAENPGENPARGMFLCAEALYKAGARYTAVACNTAHADRIFGPFRSMVEKALPGFTIVNMLETCAAFIKESRGGSEMRGNSEIKAGSTKGSYTRLGLLATKGTYKSGVYREYFKEEDGFILIEPEARGQDKIFDAIYDERFGIKSHQPVKTQAKNTIIYEIYRLAERGAEAIILGCTELPLALKNEELPIPVIDPGLITARKLISLVAPEKLLPYS
jgi:aspartate racemase